MQGGHHPKLTKQWYLDLLAHIKGKFPLVNIHGFSPSEFVHFREVFNEPLDQIIGDFKRAGLGSIPGGGGEILVDRVRKRISPLKAMSDEWLEVMDVAHRLGLNSSATMMFGHVETVEDRIEHLERVRAQQDKSLNYRNGEAPESTGVAAGGSNSGGVTLTTPVPKYVCQKRFTVTRAIRGFDGSTSQRASPSRLGGYLSWEGARATGSFGVTLSPGRS